MKVSFVIPAYNVEKYIEECVDSIINQTVQDWELIIVDDGSKDATLDICNKKAKTDTRISVVHQQNSGVSVARNNGIQLAQGDWICFVDADDVVHPCLLEIYNKYLVPTNDVCFIGYEDFEGEMLDKRVFESNDRDTLEFTVEDMELFQLATFNRDFKGKYDFYKVKLTMPGKFYRKRFLIENNIKFPIGVKTGEDAIFNLYVYRYASSGMYLKGPMYYHRIWPSSVSQKYDKNCMEKFDFMHKCMEAYINSSNNPEKFEESFRERKAWSFGFGCLLNYCHRDNPNSYIDKKRAYFALYNQEYKEVFEKLDLSQFRFQKRLLFWLIQKRMFGLVTVLCNLKR